jgi:peptidoglycan/LPS O-acetylase OafA/YrhL
VSLRVQQGLPNGQGRNFGLDLVRATAVLLVMVSHWANNIGYWYGVTAPDKIFFAGDVGVDLFFALSGLLIGRILLDMIERGPSWRALGIFLVRRWMRTLPLYWLWLAVLAIVWPPAAGLHVLPRMVLLLQNLAWPMPPGYFFAVSWSLTIEEWFYVGFAVSLVAATFILGRRVALWPVLLGFLAIPLALRILVPAYADWSNGLWHSVVYRLDCIAYGVLLAQAWRQKAWVFRHPAAPLVLGLLLIAGTWAGVLLPLRFVPALIDDALVIGAVLCLPAAMRLRHNSNWAARIITGISAQSYALYLIHLTILVDLAQGLYLHHRITRPEAVAISLGLPFLLSWLSFRFIESPLLALRPIQR